MQQVTVVKSQLINCLQQLGIATAWSQFIYAGFFAHLLIYEDLFNTSGKGGGDRQERC